MEEFLAGNLRPKITASAAPGPSELPGLLVAGGYPESIQRDPKRADCMARPPRFYHYRDRDKTEVDIVVESGRKIGGVKVKAAASVNRDDAKGLRKLAEIAGDAFQGGIVFYDGEAILPLYREAGILAVPLSKLWEL